VKGAPDGTGTPDVHDTPDRDTTSATDPPEPRWSRRLLQLLLRGDDSEFILGDLAEEFHERAGASGVPIARSWYRRQVVSTLASQLRRRPPSLTAWVREGRLALRSIRREPAYVLTTVATLAIGIGGAVLVGGLAMTITRPLPFPDSDQLFAVWETRDGQQRWVAPANYLDWRRSSSTFQGLAAHSTSSVSITVNGSATLASVASVSGNYFTVLGVGPSVGRGFDPTLDVTFAEREAVLSYDGRIESFGAGGDVLGQTILVDDLPYVVVGVMPPGFSQPERDLYAWLRSPTEAPDIRGGPGDLATMRDIWYFQVVGRLAPGVSEESARAEIESVAARLSQEYPETNETAGIRIIPLLDQTVSGFGSILIALGLAVALLLVAATFNVLHLTLARAEARRSAMAVRISLGASARDLRRGLLAEGWMVGVLGAFFATVAAGVGLDLVRKRLGGAIPRAAELSLTPDLALATVLLGLGVGSLIAVTAWMRGRPHGDLRSRLISRSGGGALVAVQVAVCIAVLSGTALLATSFTELGRVDLGFDTQELYTVRIAIPDASVRSYAERIGTYREALRAVRADPRIESAGLGSATPLSMGARAGVQIVGTPADRDPPDAGWQPIDDAYFGTLGMTVLRGRGISTSDGPGDEDIAVVNETFVRSVLAGREPLGAHVTMGLDGHDRPLTIVGVVADTRTRGPVEPTGAVLYRPIDQTTRFDARSILLAARAPESARGGTPPLARIVRTAVPELPVYAEAGRLDLVRPFRATQGMLFVIMAVFGSAALGIGLVGVYAVGMHTVRRQRREIGVRLALGATGRRVTGEVLSKGMKAALVGVPPGLLIAAVGSWTIEGLLFGVSSSGFAVQVLVTIVVLSATAIALLAPARLAAATDPASMTRAS
jgi:putative ABC transport system permease protein